MSKMIQTLYEVYLDLSVGNINFIPHGGNTNNIESFYTPNISPRTLIGQGRTLCKT